MHIIKTIMQRASLRFLKRGKCDWEMNVHKDNTRKIDDTSLLCMRCGERIPNSAVFCPFCGLKLKTGSAQNITPVLCAIREKLTVKSLHKRKAVFALFASLVIIVVLSVWGVKSIKELQTTEIIASISNVDLEVGDEMEVLVEIKNPPLDYIITYDDNPIVEEKWLDWEDDNTRIPLSIIGLEEGENKLHFYIYNRDEYQKNDSKKTIIAEKSVPITVKRRSDISLKSDREIDLLVGESATVMVTIEGNLTNDDYYLSADVVSGFLEVMWEDWVNDYQCPITVTGLTENSDKLILSLYDTSEVEEGICICSTEIKANIQQ